MKHARVFEIRRFLYTTCSCSHLRCAVGSAADPNHDHDKNHDRLHSIQYSMALNLSLSKKAVTANSCEEMLAIQRAQVAQRRARLASEEAQRDMERTAALAKFFGMSPAIFKRLKSQGFFEGMSFPTFRDDAAPAPPASSSAAQDIVDLSSCDENVHEVPTKVVSSVASGGASGGAAKASQFLSHVAASDRNDGTDDDAMSRKYIGEEAHELLVRELPKLEHLGWDLYLPPAIDAMQS